MPRCRSRSTVVGDIGQLKDLLVARLTCQQPQIADVCRVDTCCIITTVASLQADKLTRRFAVTDSARRSEVRLLTLVLSYRPVTWA